VFAAEAEAEAEAEVWHFITLAFLKWEMKVRQESRPDPSGPDARVLKMGNES
jgi:hypothetical protein